MSGKCFAAQTANCLSAQFRLHKFFAALLSCSSDCNLVVLQYSISILCKTNDDDNDKDFSI